MSRAKPISRSANRVERPDDRALPSRRAEILDRAAELFAQRGIAATTVREIGDAVGMLSGSLYHHFASKEQMIEEIIASYLEDLLRRYRAVSAAHDQPRERFAALVRTSFHSVAEHPSACRIYQRDFALLADLASFPRMKRIGATTRRIWLTTIEDGVAAGTLRSDLDPEVFYRFLRDALWMSAQWYRPGGRRPVDELADECIAIFLEGFGSR